MKLPYSWLKELSGAPWSAEEAAERLTLSGTAGVVEKADPEHFKNVVIGRITSLRRHPNADRLLVAEVDSGAAAHPVICGAPNCAVGQKVVLALPGAKLRGEFRVKEVTMRGVASAGMICAEDELGLSDDHTGIMVLDEDAPVGARVFDYLGLGEAVINFEITPDRPDCLSAIGVARELAVLAELDFKVAPSPPAERDQPVSDYIRVGIDDPDGCPRYTARIIDNVTIGPSPWWLRRRLLDCGVRPINNIVDITNYVMLETGQPLHAFDYHRFGSKEVVVRRAAPGEKFTTLDGREHILDETVLLITNGKEGVAAAGVMGGLDSEVEPDTRTILLESAYFDPTVIRRSARKLGILSESSDRFMRGTDPSGVVAAADRAASLMAELAGGEVAAGVVDTYAKKITPVTITLRPGRVALLLGVDIAVGFMENTLRRLGLTVDAGEVIRVTVPTFRPDLTREVDLIEEIARIYGLDRIPNAVQNAGPLYTPTHRRDTIKDDLRRIMTGFGFDESLGSGMAHAARMDGLDSSLEPIKILNPLSDEFAVMRSRMLYSLLVSTGNNIRHRNVDVKLFEIGRVYRKIGPEFVEPTYLGFLVTGNPADIHWRRQPEAADLFEIKGVLEALFDSLRLGPPELKPARIPGYDDHLAFDVVLGGKGIGWIGRVDPKVARTYDIKQPCLAAELEIEAIIGHDRGLAEFIPMPRYPASTRDIAVVVDQSIPAANLREAIIKSGGRLVESVVIFDLFVGDPVPEGKKSLAFSVNFRSPEKTLEDDEVDTVIRKIVAFLEKNFNARLRE